MTAKPTNPAELNANSENKQPSESTSGDQPKHVAQDAVARAPFEPDAQPTEHGGQKGLEPTRYGDWEKKGRCTDF